MSITMTKIGDPVFFGPGQTALEYSITFDTVYPTTGGESPAFGSATNFQKAVKRMIVTKPFRNTGMAFFPVLIPSTTASYARIKLYFLCSSTTNASKAAMVEVSNTTDCSAVSGRALIFGA